MSSYKVCSVCRARFTALSGGVEGCAVHGIREAVEMCTSCGEPIAKHSPRLGCPYNGWPNYETWLVKLWIDNDEGSYSYWNEAAQEAFENPIENRYMELDRRRVVALVERLKDELESEATELLGSAGLFTDLLNAALSEVDWYEIAESLLSEVDSTEEGDDDEENDEEVP